MLDPPSSPDEEIDFGSIFSQPVKRKSFITPFNSLPPRSQIIPNPPDLDFLQSQFLSSQTQRPRSDQSLDVSFSFNDNNLGANSINLSVEDEALSALSDDHRRSRNIGSSKFSAPVRRSLFNSRSENFDEPTNRSSEFNQSQEFQTPFKSNLISNHQSVQLETPSNAVIPISGSGGNENLNLRSLSEIPEKFRKIFDFPYFNVVQSKVFDSVFYSDKPLVVCAPTGSGKTVLFELAIVRMLLCNGGDANLEYKIVYMAPIKALCSERHQDWTTKFGQFGLKCTELTGDTDMDDFHVLQSSHIVLTTPEKWDSMTRRWKDNKSLVQCVRLFLIDEVHLLSDENRGATMEAVVSRMKTVHKFIKKEANTAKGSNSQLLRIIAVSATIPNVEDIADWLTIDDCMAESYRLGDEYRPVNLRKVVLGYPYSENGTDFKFDLSLNYRLSGVIQTYSDNKPTIIFCSTRKGASQAASTLTKDARFIMDAKHRSRLEKYSNSLHDSKLRDLVLYGVGYHHAGMDIADRKNIESVFVRGELPVLFCTSTLAMGVNLPAHLVVIKSTMHYVSGMYEEYTESQVLQMIGRAGRPQFDTSATAVIMTKNATKAKYEALISGSQKIESSLHHHLTEHVNAEIVLNTITSLPMTNEWLKSTFLYKRMQRNPKQYGAPEGLSEDALGKKLQAMGLRALRSLQSLDLVDIKEDTNLYPTETGKLMARYCIAFETVKGFTKIKGNESIEELVDVLSKCKEFEDITLRVNEKRTLNTLNKDKHRLTIRFPMKNKIKTTDQKINCLIQAVLGCLSINEFSLMQDVTKIFRSAQRVCRFLTEFLLTKGFYRAALNAVILCKCVQARLWENSMFVSRQLEKIGATMSAAMVNAGLTSLEKIEEANPRQIELIVNRNPPFGNQVKDALHSLPKFDISIDQDDKYQRDAADLYLKISMLNHEQRATHLKNKKPNHQHSCLLMIGDSSNNIIYRQRLMDSFFLQNGTWNKHLIIRRPERSPELSVNLISSDYVGIDVKLTFTPHYLGGFINSAHKQNLKKIETPDRRNNSAENQARKPCTHRCVNKDWCGHHCCKYGVAVKQDKKAINEANEINELEELFGDDENAAASRSTPKGVRRKSNFVDGFMEDIQRRSTSTKNGKRVKMESPYSSSTCPSNIDDYDDDLRLLEAELPRSITKSASKLKNAFSYKPKRVDFKSYIKEIKQKEQRNKKIKQESQSATPKISQNKTLDQVANFVHLRSGNGTPLRETESNNTKGKYSRNKNSPLRDDYIGDDFDYNFNLLDDDDFGMGTKSPSIKHHDCKIQSHQKKVDHDIIDLNLIDDYDDHDYDDQICPEFSHVKTGLTSDDDDYDDDYELCNKYGSSRTEKDNVEEEAMIKPVNCERYREFYNNILLSKKTPAKHRPDHTNVMHEKENSFNTQRFPLHYNEQAKHNSINAAMFNDKENHGDVTHKLYDGASNSDRRSFHIEASSLTNQRKNTCLQPSNSVFNAGGRQARDSLVSKANYAEPCSSKSLSASVFKKLKKSPPQTTGVRGFASARGCALYAKDIDDTARGACIPMAQSNKDANHRFPINNSGADASKDIAVLNRHSSSFTRPKFQQMNEISMKLVANPHTSDNTNINIKARSNRIVSLQSQCNKEPMLDQKSNANFAAKENQSTLKNHVGGSFTINWFVQGERGHTDEECFEFCDV